MVTVKQLLEGRKYKFKNLTIEVLEKDDADNVHVFSATYVSVSHDGRLSDGLREVNLLWDRDSGKRPPGYIVFGAYESNGGLCKSIMVSEEFYKVNRPKLDVYKEQWATSGWSLVR